MSIPGRVETGVKFSTSELRLIFFIFKSLPTRRCVRKSFAARGTADNGAPAPAPAPAFALAPVSSDKAIGGPISSMDAIVEVNDWWTGEMRRDEA